MSFGEDVLVTMSRVAAALEVIGATWAVGGSIASSIHGEPRATNDVDFVAAMRSADALAFVEALGPTFYADLEVITQAIADRASFNVIDRETIVKVDVFVPAPGPLGDAQLVRRQRIALPDGSSLVILGPEDTLLQKLRRFSIGGEVSDRQWRDIVSLVRIAGGALDWKYVESVAESGRLTDLLARAKTEGG